MKSNEGMKIMSESSEHEQSDCAKQVLSQRLRIGSQRWCRHLAGTCCEAPLITVYAASIFGMGVGGQSPGLLRYELQRVVLNGGSQ